MNRLKDLRAVKKKTQTQVAKFLGITQQAYATYENETRTPPTDMTIRLANYFEVSIDYLLGVEKVSDTPQFTQEELELIELYRVAPDTWKKTAKQALALGVGEKVKQEREKKNLENFSSDKFKKTL